MFCKSCGQQMNDQAFACPKCGAPNTAQAQPPQPQYQQPQYQQPQYQQPQYQQPQYQQNGIAGAVKSDRSLGLLILLSVITFGIYGIIFWYGWTEDINKVCSGDGKDSPNYIIVCLLSFITFGFYGIYWYYKQGNRLQETAPRYGLTFSENGSTVLLWMIVGSALCGIGVFIAMNILIKNLNLLARVYNTK